MVNVRETRFTRQSCGLDINPSPLGSKKQTNLLACFGLVLWHILLIILEIIQNLHKNCRIPIQIVPSRFRLCQQDLARESIWKFCAIDFCETLAVNCHGLAINVQVKQGIILVIYLGVLGVSIIFDQMRFIYLLLYRPNRYFAFHEKFDSTKTQH